MIFAAGRGTRLGALGESTPKALIEVGGRTMLERTLRRLAEAGADRVVVNVSHHADAIERWLATHDPGVEVLLSREPDGPLETGGGLLRARALFRGGAPILLHNVDVICDADLASMVRAHEGSHALATLAVQERETRRALLFDDLGLLGREDRGRGVRTEVRAPRGQVRALAFAGLHVLSPGLLERISERGAFPIVELYLRLAAEGGSIRPHEIGDALWLEIGNPERLAEARARLERSPR
jgi:NDP-sugar pyrophosphorylase family protein